MKTVKKFPQIVVSLLTAFGVMVSTIPVMAAESADSLSAEPVVTNLLSSLGESGNFSAVKTLKDANDENRYSYLPFSSGGYLIYDSKFNIVAEYSTSTSNSYIESTDLVYYAGALQYFTKNENSFVEIPTGNIVGSKEYFTSYFNAINSEVKRNYAKNRSSLPDTRAAHYISGNVPNYKHNPDGICGSTSAAMLLRWYDIYKNQKYVPSSLESGDGVDLIEHLRGYIDGDVPGSVAGDVFTGIMSYCSSQGVSHPGGFDGYNDNYVIGRVDTYGTPFLLIIHNHPTYKNHWITGYGYNISGGTCYPIVNDGWGDTNVSINPIYASQIVW